MVRWSGAEGGSRAKLLEQPVAGVATGAAVTGVAGVASGAATACAAGVATEAAVRAPQV